jgi:hypothetical protein
LEYLSNKIKDWEYLDIGLNTWVLGPLKIKGKAVPYRPGVAQRIPGI